MANDYREPLALVILSAISLGLGALAAICILLDIAKRRGWRSMMLVMIPVYIINATYLWPITLWVYVRYGRPTKSKGEHETKSYHRDGAANNQCNEETATRNEEAITVTEKAESHEYHHDVGRPFFATVTAGVCHCGAGCVLGDIVGEWLVYGTNAYIGSNPSRLLWAEMLVDFGFAFIFGLAFQYFSIAPMSGDYSWRTVVRALKADALSLISFEVGLFAWMAAFQIGIFGDMLGMAHVTYWWMMQIGMFIGHWTAVPVNIWLIKSKIKEPCA